MTYTFSCPKCGEEIEADVDVGEHMVDWAEECQACNQKFTEAEVEKIYSDALEDCFSTMVDDAHDRAQGDR